MRLSCYDRFTALLHDQTSELAKPPVVHLNFVQRKGFDGRNAGPRSTSRPLLPFSSTSTVDD